MKYSEEPREVSLLDTNGKVIFTQKVMAPADWSDRAIMIAASKYFRGKINSKDREASIEQMVTRVVNTIFPDAAGREHLKSILMHQKASFNSPVWFNIGVPGRTPQASACQPYFAKVLTEAGYVEIGKLVENNAIGTKLISPSGDCQIVAVKQNGNKKVLNIKTSIGDLFVTEDHLVFSFGTKNKIAKAVRADSIRIGDNLECKLVEDNTSTEIVPEAALAGWLLSDGYVGKPASATSIIMEAETINDEEFNFVKHLVESVFPTHTPNVIQENTEDESLIYRRIRLYGKDLDKFSSDYSLYGRGILAEVPAKILNGTKSEKVSFLKSVFQCDGYVSLRPSSSTIGLARISEKFITGVQTLLTELGISSTIIKKEDTRLNRHNSFAISIQSKHSKIVFKKEIGFISKSKLDKLETSISNYNSKPYCKPKAKVLAIESFSESTPVYDIQTTTGDYISDGIRVHNCFILSVDDNMESILELMKNEGMIFKGGSGAGVNLSSLRGSQEGLSGGGIASGPVSFMRALDQVAGAIKSGGSTRRAAAIRVLNDTHPDIMEFITCKAKEEKKALALIEQGYDPGFNVLGGAYDSIQFQNANNSVRITDKTMRNYLESVKKGKTRTIQFKNVTDGSADGEIDVQTFFNAISECAWICGDPGLQFHDTTNKWNMAHQRYGEIVATNPCGEHAAVDNTACNLASINIMKFMTSLSMLDIGAFESVVEILIRAMDNLVDIGQYPTQKITENARALRHLGLGYANLGATIMAMGLPYDSEDARDFAGLVSSLMTATAWETSIRLRAEHCAANNIDPTVTDADPIDKSRAKKVAKMHYEAAVDIGDRGSSLPENMTALYEACTTKWKRIVKEFDDPTVNLRNAQLTLIAPTGTISLLMDCDTSGIEPEFALVRYKSLVGGGSMTITNSSIDAALHNMGYSAASIAEITEYIKANGCVDGCDAIAQKDISVFDCAIASKTGRSISPDGHVLMMAAVQPHIDSAISKTVNMPADCTVDDIKNVFVKSWQLGLKSITIYRDGSKGSQPITTASAVKKLKNGRRALPDTRPAITHKFSVGGQEGYAIVGTYEDGTPGELFVKISKEGSTLSGVFDAFAIAISLALQAGVPLSSLVSKFSHMSFEPSGFTTNPGIRTARSIVDYIFRWMELEFGKKEDEASSRTVDNTKDGKTGPPCYKCGSITERNGACHKCPNCGETTGCS